MNLMDNYEEDGGFVCVPGFRHHFEEWYRFCSAVTHLFTVYVIGQMPMRVLNGPRRTAAVSHSRLERPFISWQYGCQCGQAVWLSGTSGRLTARSQTTVAGRAAHSSSRCSVRTTLPWTQPGKAQGQLPFEAWSSMRISSSTSPRSASPSSDLMGVKQTSTSEALRDALLAADEVAGAVAAEAIEVVVGAVAEEEEGKMVSGGNETNDCKGSSTRSERTV